MSILYEERLDGALPDVDRTSVLMALREGLTVLRGRGIIETAQGRDSRVARLNRVQDASPMIHLFSTQRRTV